MPALVSPLTPLLSAWDTWAFTGVLVFILPSFAYFCLYLGAKGNGYFGRISKVGTYVWIIACLWVMVLLLAVVAQRHHLAMTDLGQHLGRPLKTLTVTAVLMAVLGIMSALDFLKHMRMQPGDLEKRLAPIKQFSPSTLSELFWFIALAVSAGICEELLYRGWLLSLISVSTGSKWIGLVLSSVAFGLGHAYQGPQGVLGTGFIGLILGLIFIWVGSLVPVQILHSFVNLFSGFMYFYLIKIIMELPVPPISKH